MKTRLAPAKGKMSGLALRHEEKIEHGIDRAARVADRTTRGKYSTRIHTGTGKAKGALDRFAHQEGKSQGTPTAERTPPPASEPPPPPASEPPPPTS
ncbi:antitoxin [Streptomyces cavernae]|uniref:antitoxin n=1 Tax=Streptomyces cavernae TaxID=2259034 RepID=UPI001EE49565|nr:antitoxin [Streptomyces cavernae]